MPAQFLLIRHGQPLADARIPYLVLPGPDLSERGRLEAHQAARFLADYGVQRCVASPFARTTQTAEVISRHLRAPLTFSDAIAEHGPHEDFGVVRSRVRRLLHELAAATEQSIALITHGSPIRALLLELSEDQIDLRAHVYQGGNPAPTCGIWRVAVDLPAAQRCALVFRPAGE